MYVAITTFGISVPLDLSQSRLESGPFSEENVFIQGKNNFVSLAIESSQAVTHLLDHLNRIV